MEIKRTVFFLSAIFIAIPFILFAEEQITITTYYPSPYGSYKELRADQMAIGSTYRSSTLSDGNLLVSGNVGIGTTTPTTKLQIDAGSQEILNAQTTGRMGIQSSVTADPGLYTYAVSGIITGEGSSTYAIEGRGGKFSVAGKGNFIGVRGVSDASAYSEELPGLQETAGVLGWSTNAIGVSGYSPNYIGVKGKSGTGAGAWAGYFDGKAYVKDNVGIGTTAPGAKLEVNGNVIASTPTAATHLATKAYVDGQTSTQYITTTMGKLGTFGCFYPPEAYCPGGWDVVTSWSYCTPGASNHAGGYTLYNTWTGALCSSE